MAKSAPKHFFSKLASIQMPRSVFDLSTVDTATFGTDYLYPNYCQLVIPGDTVNLSYSNLTRFLPAIDVPMMDNVHCTVHYWFVPWRLVWKDYKYFFGEKQRGSTITSYTIPKVEFDEDYSYPVSGDIYDYFNIAIQGTDNQYLASPKFTALKYRSYNLIYDEWYMDEQRGSYSYYNDTSVNDKASDFMLLKRGKRFDYFTSSTLQPQLTNVDFPNGVTLNLGDVAPVYSTNNFHDTALSVDMIEAGHLPYTLSYEFSAPSGTSGGPFGPFHPSSGEFHALGLYSNNVESGASKMVTSTTSQGDSARFVAPSNLWTDLGNVSSVEISKLREAFQLQAYLEIMNKSGQRYIEYVYGQYGVISPDARLQRPEFLGGADFEISVVPVVQQSGTYLSGSSGTTPQGTITGYMIGGINKKHIFSRSFTEHGYIIGLINYYSDLTYYQGVNRDDYIETPLDIPLPVFANLTDEQIDRKELYITGVDNVDNQAFGYQERYAWAKYAKNTLRGKCRPNAPQTLGYWSLAQELPSNVANNIDFIESNTPIDRISAVTDEDNFIANQKHFVSVIRELPMYSDTMKWFSRG